MSYLVGPYVMSMWTHQDRPTGMFSVWDPYGQPEMEPCGPYSNSTHDMYDKHSDINVGSLLAMYGCIRLGPMGSPCRPFKDCPRGPCGPHEKLTLCMKNVEV